MQKKIAVLGAGLMGAGIACRFAVHGYDVKVYDAFSASLDSLGARVQTVLDELVEAGLLENAQLPQILARIVPISKLAEIGDVPMIIEAVPERLDLKHRLYAELEEIIGPEVILGSNTSGFTPDSLTAHMKHPERFLIMHFWNPPHSIPLVELVPGSRTRPELMTITKQVMEEVGAAPAMLQKAIPGFIGNRIQFAVLREALAILRSGAATAEEIDTVMQASLGRRWNMMGPLTSADLAGLDTFVDISSHLMPELAKDEDVIDLLREKAAAGHTGAKAGQGFHQWTAERQADIRNRRINLLASSKKA